jgi:poly-gamma-glutamate capsule biosynthesis protein CapA/YwtB (metallophosphatase superfamily)
VRPVPAGLTALLAAAALAACSGAGSGAAPAASGRPSASTPVPSPTGKRATPPPADPSAPRTATGEAVTLAFAGDANFQGPSAAALRDDLGPVVPLLERADLAMVNLETAVTTRGTPVPKGFNFRVPAGVFGSLRRSGVDVVTMANNHGVDYGQTGLRDSLDAISASRFPVVGIGADEDAAFAPHVVTVKGQRIAFLGATQVLDASLAASWTAAAGKPGLASAKDEERLVRAVAEARGKADTVVVYLHWGQELDPCPLDRQKSLAQRLVDAGADVVVGGHAHVLLGGGYLDGAYVDYGLGNFLFPSHSGATSRSGVLTLTVRGRAVTGARWSPAAVRGGFPVPLTGAQADSAGAAWVALRGCTGLSAAP